MYELIQVSENCYYIQSPAKIGLIKLSESEVCLIDSGSDKDAGRKVRQHLDKNNWKLKAIFLTHSNADHIGGCKYLQAQTGCRIFAPGIECAFTKYPVLEPSFLYGGYPTKELRHKFLMAQESSAEELEKEHLPESIGTIPLPGHFFDMVGYRTKDGIVYLADCLSSKATLEKYRIGFIYDISAYLDTLEKVKTMDAKLFIPAHAEPTEDIEELAQYNIDTVNEIAEQIIEFCAEGIQFEALLKRLFDHYSLEMNFEQYVLVGSTVRSYLSWLKESGRVSAAFVENQLIWKKSDLRM